jgi:DNA-binding MarR family transcriptional regulator
MDAYSADRANLTYSDQPPVVIAATSEAARSRALRSVSASGARVGGTFGIAEASSRLELQGAASAIWVEIDEHCGTPMDELLSAVSRDASDGRYSAVVCVDPVLLDEVAAPLIDSRVEILVNPTEPERVAALALATSSATSELRVADIAADRNAERLRQLSDEVSRIASTLARLSAGPSGAPGPAIQKVPQTEAPPVSVELIRAIIRARRLRARFFQEELFADPAWDMLLDLLQAEISQLRVPVSSLCIAAAVPATTALRWLKTMVQQGLFIRRADPHDGRRVFVELAPEASRALRSYFAEIGPVPVV